MRLLIILTALVLLSACASTARFPDNPPLARADTLNTPTTKAVTENSLLMLLSFSGGGSRASALAYGVLEELASTPLDNAAQRSVLDEVDMITAVSGGSITAAYYGLYGDRLFSDFRPRFLDLDIEAELRNKLLSPSTLAKLGSTTYGSGDVLDEFFSQQLFGSETLDQLIDGEGPVVEINATDLFKGGRFGFTPDQFSLICSDPAGFPVSRAVAASCGVPLLFTPITLTNHAGNCNYVPPTWMYQGLAEKDINNRRFRRARQFSTYLDRENHPYIHLLDGGLADNLGLRAVIDRIIESGGMWESLKRFNQAHASRIVMVVVDASSTPPSEWELKPDEPPGSVILDAATTAPLANYNFETVEYLRSRLPQWQDEIRQGRCGDAPKCSPTEFYLIDISLEDLIDQLDREQLRRIPTGFSLEPGIADRLINAGRELLRSHPEYQRLLREAR